MKVLTGSNTWFMINGEIAVKIRAAGRHGRTLVIEGAEEVQATEAVGLAENASSEDVKRYLRANRERVSLEAKP